MGIYGHESGYWSEVIWVYRLFKIRGRLMAVPRKMRIITSWNPCRAPPISASHRFHFAGLKGTEVPGGD